MVSRLLIIVLSALLVLSVAESADRPSLSGSWYLNSKKSDDPLKKIAKQMEFIDSSGARVVRTSNGPMVLGTTRRRPTVEQVGEMMAFFDGIVPLKPLARIEQDELVVVLSYIDGRERKVYTDGRDLASTVQTTAIDKEQKLVFSAWEKKALMIETNTNSGTAILEQYRLDKDNNSLAIEIAVHSSRLSKPITLKYTYSAVELKD